MTQYAHSDFDNKSQGGGSLHSSNRFSHSESISNKIYNKSNSGFELPPTDLQSPRNRSSGTTVTSGTTGTGIAHVETNNSLARVGKIIMQNDNPMM